MAQVAGAQNGIIVVRILITDEMVRQAIDLYSPLVRHHIVAVL